MSYFVSYFLKANTLFIENNKPLIFGDNQNKGIKLDGFKPIVVDFTTSTIETALHGNTQEVLGSFFYGRENVIPEMFDSLLKTWDIDREKAPTFVFYLERHIELDSGEHGPAAQKMINNLCPTNKQKMEVYLAAQKAVLARIKLWDSLNMEMKRIS